MGSHMTDEEIVDLCSRVLRKSRDPDVLSLCGAVSARFASKSFPAPKKGLFNKREYMRDYMRRRRASSNPFS